MGPCASPLRPGIAKDMGSRHIRSVRARGGYTPRGGRYTRAITVSTVLLNPATGLGVLVTILVETPPSERSQAQVAVTTKTSAAGVIDGPSNCATNQITAGVLTVLCECERECEWTNK